MKRWIIALSYGLGILALWNCSGDEDTGAAPRAIVEGGAGDTKSEPPFEQRDSGGIGTSDAAFDGADSGDAGDAGSGDAGDAGSGDAGDAGSGDAGDAGSGDAGDAGDAGSDDAGDAGDAGSGDASDAGDAGDAGSGDASDAGDAGDAGEDPDASGPGISAVLIGNLPGAKPGEAYTNYDPGTDLGNLEATFGTIDPLGGPPDDNEVYSDFANGFFDFSGGYRGVISTAVRRNGTQFFMTTYAYYNQVVASLSAPMVVNNAYWEFTIHGTYNYSITGGAPSISGNTRTYRFERVGAAVLSEDTTGTAASSFTGQVTTGTYRLTYRHRNFSPSVTGPSNNVTGGTNLSIAFTLVP
jgi:hypothetical protein